MGENVEEIALFAAGSYAHRRTVIGSVESGEVNRSALYVNKELIVTLNPSRLVTTNHERDVAKSGVVRILQKW